MAFGTQDDSDEVMNEINMTPLVAVSYTILRAHENKANLVCRILL